MGPGWNLLFDLDGTLVDSLPGIRWSIERALAACGVAVPCPDLRSMIGPPIRRILARVTGAQDDAVLDRLETAFRASYDGEGWRKTVCMPGAPQALAELGETGCGLWVVTNKPDRVSRSILRELGLERHFREVAARDSRTPPFDDKGQTITNLLQRHQLDRARTIMVGDTLEDCQAAAAARILCALVPHGYGGGLDGPLPHCCRRISEWRELMTGQWGSDK